jgi:hypothetical protein
MSTHVFVVALVNFDILLELIRVVCLCINHPSWWCDTENLPTLSSYLMCPQGFQGCTNCGVHLLDDGLEQYSVILEMTFLVCAVDGAGTPHCAVYAVL